MIRTMLLAIGALALTTPAVPTPTAADDRVSSAQTAEKPTASRITPLLQPDGMSWHTYLAIQAAVNEAARQHLPVADCRISAWDRGDHLEVAFTSAQPRDPGSFGCPPGPCCWTVDLSAAELRVLRTHGMR